MKTWVKGLICISLSFMCLFTCVGYALVSDHMNITGTATAEPPRALFIYNVSGGNYINPDTLAYSGTVVTSDVTLRDNGNGNYGASFSIEVFNNTLDSYYYHSMVRGTYTTETGEVVAYSNEDILLEVDENTLKKGDEIKAGEKKSFTVNATFKQGVNTATASKQLFSIINYYFSTTQPDPEDTGGGEAAVSGVVARFPNILNDPADYKALTDSLDANTTHPDYIGNVVSSANWDNDTELVQNLFGVALELNIDGVDTPVTVVIQRKNVDGNENTGDTYQHVEKNIFGSVTRNEQVKGADMILFMTPVDPKSVRAGSYIETYAIVYTKDANGTEWYQKGEMYKGTAQVVGYVTGITILFNDSINPDTWRQDGTNKSIENIIKALG